MGSRTVLSALGTGITVFLAVAVLVIELLDVEFSAIVGLPVGLVAGVVAFALLLSRYGTLDGAARAVVDALAGFGLGLVLLAGVGYVNLADPTLEVTVGVAVGIGLLAGSWSWLAAGRGTAA